MKELEKVDKKRIEYKVGKIFKRMSNIRKIRRKRKMKEWIDRHLN